MQKTIVDNSLVLLLLLLVRLYTMTIPSQSLQPIDDLFKYDCERVFDVFTSEHRYWNAAVRICTAAAMGRASRRTASLDFWYRENFTLSHRSQRVTLPPSKGPFCLRRASPVRRCLRKHSSFEAFELSHSKIFYVSPCLTNMATADRCSER